MEFQFYDKKRANTFSAEKEPKRLRLFFQLISFSRSQEFVGNIYGFVEMFLPGISL